MKGVNGMALGVYHQSQAQSQNIGTCSTVADGFPWGNDGVSLREEYVSFPKPAPRHESDSGGGARGNIHPSSSGLTDSSDLSRSPPSHACHNAQHPHHFNPYMRPSGKSSFGASRHLAAGILHGNIRPSNVLCGVDGSLRLIDFLFSTLFTPKGSLSATLQPPC